ncbi:MAG: hypothetical protein AAF547_11930, partial [Actinomycetota bacterium]
MGDHGPVTAALARAGFVVPDLICGMTLFLLARQPRPERPAGASGRRRASAIDGGVWVREQFTVHRPIERGDPFRIEGTSEGRFVRKGRRYGVNAAVSHDSAGRLVATNLTCGL